MWDMRVVQPFDRLSKRNIILFFSAILVTIFAYSIILSPAAFAADATWRGESIMYDGNQYIAAPSPAAENDPRGLPKDTTIYQSRSAENTSPLKLYVLYFTPNERTETATSANYAEYDFVPPNTYTNQTNNKTVALEPRDNTTDSATSCDGEFTFGVGWIICPVANFMSSAMDWLFGVLTEFLVVRPIQTQTDSVLFRAWSMMRGFANIAFVIAFLIIIYSQLSSFGITNYGIKKLLPRLIVAAVLVNISYYICAIAVDISNVLGYSIQDIFISMRNNIVGGSGNSWDIVSWKSIGGFILSGGTTALAGVVGVKLLIGTAVGGSLYLILPILLSALLSVLVALLVMAARQAVITILIILAPLAFVAYLLPNTEGLFKKWRSTFMTLLVLFPAFSVVFGGSQLAGIAIIQNADSINLVLLGMAVQVVPLAITPLLIKLGGGLMNRFAGIINNPSKGVVDRSRKWAQDRADKHKDRVLADPNPRGLNRRTQVAHRKKQSRDAWQKTNQSLAENRVRSHGSYAAIETATREANRDKQIIDQQFESTWNVNARLDPSSLEREIKLRVTADESEVDKSRLEAVYGEIKSGKPVYAQRTLDLVNSTDETGALYDPGAPARHIELLNRASDASTHLALAGMKKKSAEEVTKQQLTDVLLDDKLYIEGEKARDYAGGIRKGGADSALTAAVASQRKDFSDQVSEKNQLLQHFNPGSQKMQQLAMGNSISVEKDGINYTFKAEDEYVREAAISHQLRAGSEPDKIEIIKESGAKTLADGTVVKGKTHDFRTTISGDVVTTGLNKKMLVFNARIIDDIAQGKILGQESIKEAALYQIMKGKISESDLAVQGTEVLELFYNAKANFSSSETYNSTTDARTGLSRSTTAREKADLKAIFDENYAGLVKSAGNILDDKVNKGSSQASRRVFEKYR